MHEQTAKKPREAKNQGASCTTMQRAMHEREFGCIARRFSRGRGGIFNIHPRLIYTRHDHTVSYPDVSTDEVVLDPSDPSVAILFNAFLRGLIF